MIAKTPPMGWNSWDCYGASVTEQTVRENAEYMAKHLKSFGYEYIVVDIQWSEPKAVSHQYNAFTDLTMDGFGRLLPAENRFPSAAGGTESAGSTEDAGYAGAAESTGFKPLGDFIHSLGLKFGIHIMRGVPRQAVHRNLPVKGTDNITARQIARTDSICYWNTDMYGIDHTKPGAKEYYRSIFELYAQWGVDFVKVDDIAREFHFEEINLIREAIDNCGREMVLSISPGASPLEQAEFFKEKVNMWRITDDFWDEWNLLHAMFERAEKWASHSGAGHWPDADMLPVAAVNQCYSEDGWTKFTQDEQRTMMTLWCFLRSPLMIGSELTKLDDFTLEMLTNRDLLEMLDKSRCARQVYRRSDDIIWLASHTQRGHYIGIFNTSNEKREITVNLQECELFGKYKALDLWSKEKTAIEHRCAATVNPHGVRAFYLLPV